MGSMKRVRWIYPSGEVFLSNPMDEDFAKERLDDILRMINKGNEMEGFQVFLINDHVDRDRLAGLGSK